MIDSRTYYNDGDAADRILRLKVPTDDGIIPSESSSGSDSSAVSDSRYHNRRKRRNYRRRIKDFKKTPVRGKGMADYDLVEPSKVTFTDDQFMLFPVRIWGFVLRERRWCTYPQSALVDSHMPVLAANNPNQIFCTSTISKTPCSRRTSLTTSC